MIQNIKPGSQSTSPSLIILGQSIVYAEVVAKQTGEQQIFRTRKHIRGLSTARLICPEVYRILNTYSGFIMVFRD